MLTSEQEIALAKAVEDCTRAMRREILGIPLAARFMIGRYLAIGEIGNAQLSFGKATRREEPGYISSG